MLANGDVLDMDRSVDDIFTQLSIPQIQNLAQQYKVNGDAARDDLHNLVASKYRDLIKIAEYIQDMYEVGSKVDSSLSELSYRSSKFVNFNHKANPVARFDTSIRSSRAKETQLKSKTTILRNVVNNILIAFDVSIHKINHTSEFVNHAKVFYTVDSLFGENLLANPHLHSTYTALKSRFETFLRSELAAFSVLSKEQNDLKSSNQSFDLQDMLSKTTSEFDTFNDDATFEENGGGSYYTNSSPIVNYLLAYLILTKKSLLEIIDEFAEMRFSYLQNLLLERFDGSGSINFLPLLKYLENSCQYLYLFAEEHGDFMRTLSSVKSWKSHEVIGFNDWLHSTEVDFDSKSYLSNSQDDVKTSIDRGLQKFPNLILKFISKLMNNGENEFENITYPIKLFTDFVTNLKKLQDHLENEDLQFLCLQYINQDKVLSNLLKETIAVVDDKYRAYFTNLYLTAKELLANTNSLNDIQLFTLELVELMDKNMDTYIENMRSNIKPNGASKLVSNLFNAYSDFAKFVLINNSDSSLNSLVGLTINWQEFNTDSIRSGFTQLGDKSSVFFWDYVGKFIDEILDQLSGKVDLLQVYYFLETSITISRETEALQVNDALKNSIHNCLKLCFSNIIATINLELPPDYIAKISHIELEENPKCPSLIISRLVLGLSKRLLSANSGAQKFQYGKLFLEKMARSIFVPLKNEIFDKIITSMISEYTASSNKESNELDKDADLSEDDKLANLSKLKTSLAERVVSDIAYLVCFTSNEVQLDSKPIQEALACINKDQTLIDDTTATLLLRGMNDFYNSCKGIYLPLLYN